MQFRVEQRIVGDVDSVARAFTDPDYYVKLGELPKLGTPTLLERVEEGGTVKLRIRFRFTGHLSPAARAVLDPAKLTWVEVSTHDLAARRVQFRMIADHYRDRFRCSGAYWFESVGDGQTRRTSEGDVTVKTPFVGRVVEQAIISGLREHLEAEVAVMEGFVATDSGTG
ncbi:MAG: DUF2505 family protein [Acidimicrobiales bacterium]